MKKITFKSVDSLAEWVARKASDIDCDARIIISEYPDSKKVDLVNSLIKHGLPLKGLTDEGGVLFISNDGIGLEKEGNERDFYDIIMIHSVEKLQRKTVEVCSNRCNNLIRFCFKDEENKYKKQLEEKELKKSELSKKEVLKLPEGFTVREDRHGLRYNKENDGRSINYSFYTSEVLDDDELKKITDSVIKDFVQ